MRSFISYVGHEYSAERLAELPSMRRQWRWALVEDDHRRKLTQQLTKPTIGWQLALDFEMRPGTLDKDNIHRSVPHHVMGHLTPSLRANRISSMRRL